MSFRSSIFINALALTLAAGGCTQVRGRKQIQEANELYKRGRYAEAVAAFEVAETLVPALPTLWLNKGYTCRQLIAPGGKDPASQRAAACALASFAKLHALSPGDPRADQLTIQTLFDTDDFPALERTFLERNRRAPDDFGVVRGLQEVYFKWGKWRDALIWSKRAAALRPTDAETQYGVGTFVWQLLSGHGGGPEMAAHDPWRRLRRNPQTGSAPPAMGSDEQSSSSPDANAPSPAARPPATAASDITGDERVALADVGIDYLQRSLALRTRYPEAMTYLALLWRQKSFGLFGDPIAWQGAVDEADEWQRRAALARGGKS